MYFFYTEGIIEEINTYTAHNGAVNSLDLNDELCASGSGDHSVHLWHVENFEKIASYHHEQVVECVAFTGNNILSGSWDGKLKLFDTQRQTAQTILQVF